MISQAKQYLKLKREAKRLMQLGDLEHYLRILRELHMLRQPGMGRAGLQA